METQDFQLLSDQYRKRSDELFRFAMKASSSHDTQEYGLRALIMKDHAEVYASVVKSIQLGGRFK